MADDQEPTGDYGRYMAEISAYEREFLAWENRGKKIVSLYKDDKNTQNRRKRYNVLWSNVQTLKPALYARTPEPIAERRFKDADPLGRTASEVLERCISYTLDCQDFDAVMRKDVDDSLLPGRGVMWWRYEAEMSGEGEDEEVSYERAVPDYVNWPDFGHNVARTWDEVWMVWRKVYLKRDELVRRFGKEVGNAIPLDWKLKNLRDEKVAETVNKACIYQAWDKEKGLIVSLSKGYKKVIKSEDNPLKLTNGFPCACPLYATLTNDSLVPVPDYALYQTQAQEIENLTKRIVILKKALKVAGVYDTSAPELGNLLNEGYENKLIPVDQWAAFAEKGGLKGAMDFLPFKEIADVLLALYQAREQAKEDLYEITGMSDIIRGNSDPRETAKAQQIKSNFAVLRISDRQQDVQRFARDNIRICAEIIAEHFDLETIKQISGVKLLTVEEKQVIQAQMGMAGMNPQQQPQIDPKVAELMKQPAWEDVHALLKDQVLREFRIDIETDSTIRTDEDMERESRTEFLNAAGGYIKNVMEAVQVAPDLGPLAAEMLMFGVRSFRTARQLEPVFEDTIKRMEQSQGQERPDPEMAKVQGELALKEKEMQLKVQQEQAVQQAQAAQETQRQQLEDQRSERDSQREERVALHKANVDANAKIRVEEIKAQIKRSELDHADRTAETGQRYKAQDHENHRQREDMRKATLAQVEKLLESLKQLKGQNLH